MVVPAGPGCARPDKVHKVANITPAQAAVVWYSQTGHTARYGWIIRDVLQDAGPEVLAADYRDIESAVLSRYDLVFVGPPVFYMNVPSNFRDWLDLVTLIPGTAVASFSTFGGPGDGQDYVARRLLSTLGKRVAPRSGPGRLEICPRSRRRGRLAIQPGR